MHRSTLPVALAASLLLAGLPAAADTTLLKDTFSDDAAGANPNGPEVGTAYYPGLSVPATSATTYRVFDDGGNLALRVSAPGPVNSADNGSLIDYFPGATAPLTRVDYRFRIEAGATFTGRNAFGQELVLSPGGTNYLLAWADDGHLWDGMSSLSTGGFDLQDTGRSFALDRDYAVSLLVDVPAGKITLSLDGVVIHGLSGLALTGGVGELAFFNNFASTGDTVIDDVRITAVPEPATGALSGAGAVLLALAAVRRRRGGTARA